MQLVDVKAAARGRWPEILLALGAPKLALSKTHGPCPLCGGKDRYRFTDRDGDGWYFCNNCGAGDGLKLLEKLNGWSFPRVVDEVIAVCGGIQPKAQRPKTDHAKARAALWSASAPIQDGDASHVYLKGRIPIPFHIPLKGAIRTAPPNSKNKFHCMVGVVCDDMGKPATLHRTWVLDKQKAPIDEPKMLMPGPFPAGSAIRLYEHNGTLGVAEGIETAIAATALHKVPTWALISAENMRKFRPPSEVKELVIFGDSDASFTGQSVAYDLARRTVADAQRDGRQIAVTVRLPDGNNIDWCEVAACGF